MGFGAAELALFIPLAAIVMVGTIIIVAILKSGSSKGRSEDDTDAYQVLQELHRGLSRMEERVEALETLLLERRRD